MGPNSPKCKRQRSSTSSSDISAWESSESLNNYTEKQLMVIMNERLLLIHLDIMELTHATRESNAAISSRHKEVVSEITDVMKTIDETVKQKINETVTHQPSTVRNVDSLQDGSSMIEAEAMRVKATLSNIWDIKLNARKNAFWGLVRNDGYLKVHEKWIASERVVIPRKFQKFAFDNESEDQKRLRERSVMQEFRNEIEMEKLKVSSCMERVRRLDMEMHQIIQSKCTGRVAACLIDMWNTSTKRNEEISFKRWENNNKWVSKYEEDFRSEYSNSNPFFKRRQYFESPQHNSQMRRQGHQHNFPDHPRKTWRSYAEVVKEKHPQTDSTNIENLLLKLLSQINGRSERQTDDREHQHSRRDSYRQRRGYNRSNNSDERGDGVTQDTDHYFMQADHNWSCQY